MASSTLPGDRRWASARRSGITVLGKVAVPKPINLPGQKLENHGLDPNVEIVPKGTLSWGSKSSSASNAWASSTVSPIADGSANSPSHLSACPSFGESGTRPSTAGSDQALDTAPNAWGSNSRPSSASGALSSSQTSLASLRPCSAETRPGSSQLSHFAEPSCDNSVTGSAERLDDDFNEDFLDHSSWHSDNKRSSEMEDEDEDEDDVPIISRKDEREDDTTDITMELDLEGTATSRWASARRGGMTVLGKVAVPKPINLPSQKEDSQAHNDDGKNSTTHLDGSDNKSRDVNEDDDDGSAHLKEGTAASGDVPPPCSHVPLPIVHPSVLQPPNHAPLLTVTPGVLHPPVLGVSQRGEKENPGAAVVASVETALFCGFTVPSCLLQSLERLHAMEGDFWSGSLCQGSELTNAMIAMLGRAARFLDRSWDSLSVTELELLVSSVTAARALKFKVSNMELIAAEAQKMLDYRELTARHDRLKAELEQVKLELKRRLGSLDMDSTIRSIIEP